MQKLRAIYLIEKMINAGIQRNVDAGRLDDEKRLQFEEKKTQCLVKLHAQPAEFFMVGAQYHEEEAAKVIFTKVNAL